MAQTEIYTFPATVAGLELAIIQTLSLRRAGFKTRLAERNVKNYDVISVVAHQDRPSRKVRLHGFNNER
jgi:hypothetical protein